jgi:hypothetical protein
MMDVAFCLDRNACNTMQETRHSRRLGSVHPAAIT